MNKMKQIVAMVLALGLAGCSWQDDEVVHGQGAPVITQRPLGDKVDRILAMVPADITLVPGAQRGIRVEGQENLLPYLTFSESGRKLEIEVKEGYQLSPGERIRVTITLPVLRELALAGGSQGEIGAFEGDELTLSLAGSGGIRTDRLEMKRLEGNIAGSGDLALGQGHADSLTFNIAGSGGIAAGDLLAREVEINIAGSGDVAVRAEQRLTATIAGSGSIDYWGDPEVESEILGVGQLVRKGG